MKQWHSAFKPFYKLTEGWNKKQKTENMEASRIWDKLLRTSFLPSERDSEYLVHVVQTISLSKDKKLLEHMFSETIAVDSHD